MDTSRRSPRTWLRASREFTSDCRVQARLGSDSSADPTRRTKRCSALQASRQHFVRYAGCTIKDTEPDFIAPTTRKLMAAEPGKLHKLKYQGAVDADGHVLEDAALWDRYIEAKYKPGAVRIRQDDRGEEHLEIGGKFSKIFYGPRLSGLSGMGATRDGGWHVKPGYGTGAPFGAMDPKERLARIEGEGLAAAFIYPTLSLLYETECEDLDLAQALTRAYNRWIVDFYKDSGCKLIPIAHLSLGDPAAAARELERAVKDGCKGAFVAPFTITKTAHGDKAHDRVFAAAQALDVPLAIHPTFEPVDFAVHHRFDNFRWAVWYYDLFAGQGVQHAFATLCQCGTFDRFPGLRVVVLESGAGWIGYFFDRADAIYAGTTLGTTVRLKEKPSYYFKERCFISADPDERTIAAMM